MRRCLNFPIAAGFLCLLLVVFFHSPRWWLISRESPGTFEWDRARSYLLQCENPFREDVEPAMRWRFVPQIFIHAVGGGRAVALALPWLGALALAAYLFHTLKKNGYDAVTAFLLCTVLSCSAPILVSTGWLAFNDAWVALGLLVLAFGRSGTALVISCIVCPFIDERFVFGVPGALLLRYYPFAEIRWWTVVIRICAALAPFVACRAIGLASGRSGGSGFLLSSVHSSAAYLWVAPLALWMAFRFAYIPATQRLQNEYNAHRVACTIIVCTSLIPVLIGFTLAADTMRTAGILLPLCLWGLLGPTLVERKWAWWLALGNLIVPAAHVTATKIMPINSALIEIWRLLR